MAESESSRASWKGTTPASRVRALSRIYVEHEAVVALKRHIERELLVADARSKASATLIISPSGAGKTSFINHLKRLYPNAEETSRSIRPVAAFEVPEAASPGYMAAALLKALGDPLCDRGTAYNKKQRAFKLLEVCETRIVAIDNFHDITARRAHIGVKHVGDWVRDLCEVGIPMVVLAFGTAEAAVVRDSNEQLLRRMQARLELPVFGIEDAKRSAEFCRLLRTLDNNLPLACASGLDSADLAARMFRATAGNLDYIIKLLEKALLRAVARGSERIELADLHRGFIDQHQVAAHGGNPFAEGYDGTPLNMPGQVFYRAPEAAVAGQPIRRGTTERGRRERR